MKRLILILAILLLLPALAFTHPGRTGKDGCHVCRTNCDKWGVPSGKKHCHNQKSNLVKFVKACDGGDIPACVLGGNLIQNSGKQYSPEWKKAAAMFQKACDAGEDAGCFNLGALYYREGRASKAKKMFEKACDMENQPACDNVKWLSK